MASQEHETSSSSSSINGWPLGLEIMNVRLQLPVTAAAQAAAAAAPAAVVEEQQQPLYSTINNGRAISFSSFSSSNLDTESTASFFQDNSTSLGRLIGLKAGDGAGFYFQKSIRFEERERISVGGTCSNASQRHGVELSHGICIPLLLKMKSKSRQ